MKIGIICAMDIEVATIIEMMNESVSEEVSGIKYLNGKIHGYDTVVAKCGVGKINAAVCTQTMILKYNPDVIINPGVAGSLTPDLRINDLVISDFVVQHDMDTTAVGDPVGFISDINIIKIPSNPELVEDIKNAAKSLPDIKFLIGTVATGDQFVVDPSRKKFITDNFNALCVEMEGGAIGHVCYMNNVDFSIIRAISDNADEKSPVDFYSFVKIAAQKSADLLSAYIKNI